MPRASQPRRSTPLNLLAKLLQLLGLLQEMLMPYGQRQRCDAFVFGVPIALSVAAGPSAKHCRVCGQWHRGAELPKALPSATGFTRVNHV